MGPHPKFISGSLLRGLLPALYYRLEALAPGFGAPSILRQDSLPPGDSRTFRKICDRLQPRTGVGSSAQGFLPDQARHDHILNFKLDDEMRQKNDPDLQNHKKNTPSWSLPFYFLNPGGLYSAQPDLSQQECRRK